MANAPVQTVGVNEFFGVANLRNGALADIVPFTGRGSIPDDTKWIRFTLTVPANTNARVATFAKVIAGLYAAAALNVSANRTWANIPQADKDAAMPRAYLLAGMRIGLQASLALADGDLAGDETMRVKVVFAPDAAGTAVTTTITDLPAGITQLELENIAAPTPALVGLMNAAIWLGAAVAPPVGASLVLTGHHCVPTTYSFFNAVENQCRMRTDATAWTLLTAIPDWQDIVRHKAAHPVSSQLLMNLAMSADTKERYLAAGHGSSVVRIPVTSAQAHRLGTVIALVGQVRDVWESFNVRLDVDEVVRLRDLVTNVGHMYHSNPADAGARMAYSRAINEVDRWMERNVGVVAELYGVFACICEDEGRDTGRNAHSLLGSYSGRKATDAAMLAVARGRDLYRQYRAAHREAVAAGAVVPSTFA